MAEVEKHRQTKKELESILAGGVDIALTSDRLAITQEKTVDDLTGKPDRNMKVCEICGALQSNADTSDRLQMHLEGKLHQGYLKIREMLKTLKAKREDDRRRGADRTMKRDRSRSRERMRREAKDKLKDEAKLFFYYSSNRWGVGSNMPKLSMVSD